MDYRQQTSLQLLELEHAQRDAGTLEDIENSNALTTDQSEFSIGYVLRMLAAIASIGMGTNAAYWGFSPPAAILTYINDDIGPSDNASLFPIIWTLTCGISIIFFGRFSDKFGRRWFMIGASLIGCVGGIIACTAPNMDTLVAANVFLGFSGGIHTCYALTVGEICPNKFKLAGSAFVTIPCILSTGFGAYISSRLVHTGAGWRWCYYSYLMMMGCAAIMQYLFYKPPSFKQLHGGKRTLMEEFRRIDFVGAFLLTAGLVMFLLGISWGGQPIPWTSPRILCLIVIGAVLIVAFVFWEMYSTTPNPLVPMYFFRDLRGFTCLVVICSVSGASYVAPTVVWPSQVAAVYGVGTTDWQENAWLNTTVSFGIIGGIWFWGPMVSVVKHVRIQLLVLAAMTCAFNGALASSNRDNKKQSAAFSFLATLPDGIMELMPVALAQMDANDADLGTVFGIVFLFRTVCGSIFTTIYLAILQNKLPIAIAQRVPAVAEAAGLPSSSLKDILSAASVGTAAALGKVPGMNPTIAAQIMDAVVDARVWSYKFIYLASIPVNFCAVVAAFFLKDYDSLLSSHVPRQIYAHGEGVKRDREEGAGDIEDGAEQQAWEKGQTEEIDDAAAAPTLTGSNLCKTKN